MERRVVVTGCGVVSPVGVGKKKFWESLISGESGISHITQFDASKFDSQIAGEVKDFDVKHILSPKEIKRTARFVQFALSATHEAIEESGLDLSQIDPFRIGVIVGSGIGSIRIIEKEHTTYLNKGPKKISPFLIPMLITNEAAGIIAIHFKIKGINFCTVTACASGAHAIGEAYNAIKLGRADVIIAGGTEACITSLGVGGFCSLKALSTRNSEPKKASRPFDKHRDGFVISEGAGIVILENLEHAKKRGASIYGELAGYGATCDAYHITAPDPQGTSAAKSMQLALEEAKIDISEAKNLYLNAHGTSTVLNDKMETQAVKIAFGSYAHDLLISSTKSMMGHALGAAGAIEFIICCLTLRNKVIPPTINYETPDPECDLNYTPNEARKANVKACLSNSLGFGGHNATLLVKELT